MAGSTLYGDTKLNFFPTSIQEIYRMIALTGRLSVGCGIESTQKREELKTYIGKNVYQKILEKALKQGIDDPMTIVYENLLLHEDFQAINKFFNISFGYSMQQTITIADLFAGEAKWLELFKSSMNGEKHGAAKLHLIANELETNRYNQIKNNAFIDESYHGSFEQLNKLPQGSISLMLFNPPYGETNGIRNVKHYLQMIIDKRLLYKSNKHESYYNSNGKMIMVIRKDDVLDSLPLIIKHFKIHTDWIYKVNKDEFKKYKQFVLYVTLKDKYLDDNNVSDTLKIQEEISKVNNIILNEPVFDLRMYNHTRWQAPAVPYKELKNNFKIVQEENFIKSDLNNDTWNWIIDSTKIEDLGNEIINKPVAPKSGELSNIIASGMINGNMKLENGTARHIVAGSMKKKIHEEEITEQLANGEEQLIKKKMIYSEPYLNVLISENSKAKIKELSSE